MFINESETPIENPFVRQITYPIAVVILVLLFALPMTYELLGVGGLFISFQDLLLLASWKGFPPR